VWSEYIAFVSIYSRWYIWLPLSYVGLLALRRVFRIPNVEHFSCLLFLLSVRPPEHKRLYQVRSGAHISEVYFRELQIPRTEVVFYIGYVTFK
jgi:hypothetical protein